MNVMKQSIMMMRIKDLTTAVVVALPTPSAPPLTVRP